MREVSQTGVDLVLAYGGDYDMAMTMVVMMMTTNMNKKVLSYY